jgi:two-component system sensor histidine kinase KdpD
LIVDVLMIRLRRWSQERAAALGISRRRLVASALGYGYAVIGVFAMSVVIALILSSGQIAKVSPLYIIVVLWAAARFGRGPAIVSSLFAFVVYDFFFTEPFHEFTIKDPEEWLSLLVFLVTAVISAQMAGNERLRTQQAERREHEAVLLFDTLRLLSAPDIDVALRALAERLRTELHVGAVRIDLAIGAEAHSASAGDPDALSVIEPRYDRPLALMQGGREPTAGRAGAPGRWIRVLPPRRELPFELSGRWQRYVVPVRVGDRSVGSLVLTRESDGTAFGPLENRFLAVIVTQLGILVQRGELAHAATEAELLRQASELKSALLNAVSHDLRTPLASIMASAGSLRQRNVRWSDQDREAFAREIEQESDRLNRIVSNLLDLSRIEAGVLQPAKEMHDIRGLIDDVVGRVGTRSGRTIAVDVPADLPPIPLDYVEIDQVLTNLIENALKYGGSDAVEVHVRRDGSELQIEVADRGPGISQAALPRLFEPFFRASSHTPMPAGLGLGLAVAKGLVEAHGGRIRVENREPHGARFVFTLPLATAEPPRVEATA